jgi:hypothetical protein
MLINGFVADGGLVACDPLGGLIAFVLDIITIKIRVNNYQ